MSFCVGELDGVWRVTRTGGALPPLIGVRKRIEGARGVSALGRLPGIPFEVDGLTLRYLPPLGAFVDELERAGEGYSGRATFHGREYGRFCLTRLRQ